MVNVGSYDESEDALQLSSSPPLTLAADTAALLAQFFTEKTDKEQELRSFIEPQDAPEATCDAEPAAPRCISPEKFTQLWTEDWQLSRELSRVSVGEELIWLGRILVSVPL